MVSLARICYTPFMARTTSNSKAKTKTAKRSAAAKATARTTKSTKKPVASKATKSTRGNKSAAAKAAKPAVPVAATKEARAAKTEATKEVKETRVKRVKRELTAATLRRWHGISVLVFAVLAVAAGSIMKPDTYQVTLGHLAPDALLSTTTTVFAPAYHVLYELELRWWLVAILALSAMFSLVRMTRLAATEARGRDIRVLPWRWVDWAITGALIVEVIALVNGAHDVVTLKLFAVLTAASVAFAWLAEREAAGVGRVVKATAWASGLTILVVLLGLAAYTAATPVYGMVRAPWYAYALTGGVVLVTLLAGWNLVKSLRANGRWADYLYAERNYVMLNLLAKAGFAIALIVGLYKV
jgi:hypothetical protein